MNLTPVQISNIDWQTYKGFCQKLFLDNPIRRLDAVGIAPNSPSAFLATLLPWSFNESIKNSIATKTAKHVSLSFIATEYTDAEILAILTCADIHSSDFGTDGMLLSGTLLDWYSGTVCLCAKKNIIGSIIYTHLTRAGFGPIFDSFDRVPFESHFYLRSK